MSLFQVRNVWSCEVSKTQQFDGKHLAVGILDEPSAHTIVIASFAGSLRLYRPAFGGYSQNHLLFQTNFNEPILQVHISSTIVQNVGPCLAILFIKKLVIVNFPKGGAAGSLVMNKVSEFAFQKPCFNFHLQPHFTNSLNSELLYLSPPSCLPIKAGTSIYPSAVSKKSKSFYYIDGQQLVRISSGAEQWRVIIGDVNQIHIFEKQGLPDELICVGQRCIWIVDDNANILSSKRIDNDVASSMIVPVVGGYNIVIATWSQHMFIYKEGKLIWAAKCDVVPIALEKVTVGKKPGMIAMLSDHGVLEVIYLGTEPPVQEIDRNAENITLQQVQSEIVSLEKVIESKKIEMRKARNSNSAQEGAMKVTLMRSTVQWTDDYVENDEKLFKFDNKIRVFQVQILLEFSGLKANDIKVFFDLPTNLYAQKGGQDIKEMLGGATKKITCRIYALTDKFPYSDRFNILTSYTLHSRGKEQQLKAVSTNVPLPLGFQALRVAGAPNTQKGENKSSHKLILVASKQLPRLMDMFKDVQMISENSALTSSVFFRLPGGIEVSVSQGKNNPKYKIQSEFYQGLCLVLIEFINRIKKLGASLSIESVPLQELFLITESHYKCIKDLKKAEVDLQESTIQFRTIQKRILAKLKQKSSELNSLDQLLSISHKQIIEDCDTLESFQQSLAVLNHQLMISVKIVCELLFLRGKTSDEGRKIISGILSVKNEGYTKGWGWEQQVLVNSAPLLNKKVSDLNIQEIEYDRLKKTLLWLVDKAAKGQIK